MRVLAVAVLVIGSAATGNARMASAAAQDGATAWIQICSGDGVSYIRIGDGDDQPRPTGDCGCDFCICGVIHAGFDVSFPLPVAITLIRVETDAGLKPARTSPLPVAAEQLWSASRGPSDRQKRQMILLHLSYADDSDPRAFGLEIGGSRWA